MKAGRWLRNHPRLLERAYQITLAAFTRLDPLIRRIGYSRASRLMRPVEEASKGAIFDCRMCGMCVLHSTGMICPMTCPKSLRNGPCGGVRANGHCEVIPEMMCVWVEAVARASQLSHHGPELLHIQPPLNHLLKDSSAWINHLSGAGDKVQPGWVGLSEVSLLDNPASGVRQVGAGWGAEANPVVIDPHSNY